MEGLNLPPHIYVPSLLVPSYHCCLQDRPPAPPLSSPASSFAVSTL